MTACMSLFQDEDLPETTIEEDEDSFLMSTYKKPSVGKKEEEKKKLSEDPFLKKILANSKQPARPRKKLTENIQSIPEF